MIERSHIQHIADQAKEHLSPDSLLIILGPTASGKTRLAVKLALHLDGEIISADSRQVYRQMDIGTGKDLQDYGKVPYHLINIAEPGEHYQADRFRTDFFRAYNDIVSRGKRPILCGGTGSYIQSVLQQSIYSQIPKDAVLQASIQELTKDELRARINQFDIPTDFKIDFDSHKRMVRALEILLYLKQHQPVLQPLPTVTSYYAIGLNPPLEQRREAIHLRLLDRLQQGLIAEVQHLLDIGLTHADLHYYGLEYRYVGIYLQGILTYPNLEEKMTTEIQRFAKRQMTYFRKMEKDGILIHWIIP